VQTTEWLIRNSLDGLKMTIYDVLAPTAVPHLSQYVALLKKTVFTKV
jgi:hypothetical protein